MKDNTQSKVPVPLRELDWTIKSPFFIKQSKSFKPQTRYVTITECGANSKEKVHEDKDSKSTNSKPTYKTATNKTLKDHDYHHFMLFYFEPTVQELCITLTGVTRPKGTDSGTFTPGHSHIESDSSMPDIEYQNGQGNIDRAFIELVGKLYVFPLQAEEEDIS